MPAGMAAFNWVELAKAVVTVERFHCKVSPGAKPLPKAVTE
jgi:hypothetical protein